MAKIARTPFNAARWLTKEVSSTSTIGQKLTGYCLFVTADSAVDLNVDYLNKGSYFKVIVKENTSDAITLTLPSAVLVSVSDNGSSANVVEGGLEDATITIPSGTTAGTYLDFICDGNKWYVQGMAHGTSYLIIS
jgi:hypothetical protein